MIKILEKFRRKYGIISEKYHAKIMIDFFESEKDVCGSCPYRYNIPHFVKVHDRVCKICFKFLDLDSKNRSCPCSILGSYCPCFILGSEEASKRTWLKLEEKGYLDSFKTSFKN